MSDLAFDKATTGGFTGHRPPNIGGYKANNPVARYVLRRTREMVLAATREYGYRTWISGMAQGFDWIGVFAVLLVKREYPDLRIVAAVPCEGQESQWPKSAQNRYHRGLALCDHVVVVSPGQPYSHPLMQLRNIWMVDRISLLISCFDGSKGGTKNCLTYARTCPDPPKIWYINPTHYE